MRKGEKMSDEQKAKVSASRKGKALGNQNGFKKGQVGRNKGKTFSPEWRKRLSEAHKGKVSPFKGKKVSLEGREKMRQAKVASLKSKYPDYEYRPNPRDDRKWVRRMRVKEYGGLHSNGEWETLKAQYDWTCPSCNKKEPEVVLTRDHVIPVSRGGSDNIENIQPLCKSCNSRKSTSTIKY